METNRDIKIQAIISELFERNVLPAKPSSYKKLSGGTVSELYILSVNDRKYVLKLNDPALTEPEASFLNTYRSLELLPKLRYVDPSLTYIVYSFISGSTAYEGTGKKEILEVLAKELINKYQEAPLQTAWGWADSQAASWREFLRNEINYAQNLIASLLGQADHQLIADLVEKIDPNNKPYLLHGDCGFHNFIFTEQLLVGVIDPAPVIGDPFYDLVYAFCSTPDDLTRETIDYAMDCLTEKPSGSYELVLICLYLRIALCSKHHPEELPLYLNAWRHWLEIVEATDTSV